jgi:hypothetical protein
MLLIAPTKYCQIFTCSDHLKFGSNEDDTKQSRHFELESRDSLIPKMAIFMQEALLIW